MSRQAVLLYAKTGMTHPTGGAHGLLEHVPD